MPSGGYWPPPDDGGRSVLGASSCDERPDGDRRDAARSAAPARGCAAVRCAAAPRRPRSSPRPRKSDPRKRPPSCLQCGGRVGASRLESLSQRGFGRLQCSRNDFVYGSHFNLIWVCRFRFKPAGSTVGSWRFTPCRRLRLRRLACLIVHAEAPRSMHQYLNDAADFSDWGKNPREGFGAEGHETRAQ